jgi:AmmeMemoRadiSam system protein B/AmmeMemoRadiSam system protein A
MLISISGLAADGTRTSAAATRTREPAVAGLFYPKDPDTLGRTVDRLLAEAKGDAVPGLRALVCPHAGYEYSGPTAARGYRLLEGTRFPTVLLLAPSHYAALEGACVSTAAAFRTPLGSVPIADLATRLAQRRPFVPEAPARVQRPAWAAQSSRPPPARDEETADTWEHSDEVQVPFLQRTLKDFRLVPVVMGDVDPEAAARALAEFVDDRTLLVVSSDLSHYLPYDEARTRDQATVGAICRLDVNGLRAPDACGRIPILTLMHLARQKGWKARLMDYRNSGDTAGDKRGVVGYAAIAFTDTPAAAYSPAEQARLLELARTALRDVTAGRRLPSVDPNQFSPRLSASRACFVTLTRRGELRGCIGNLQAQGPLYQAVLDNARSAALRDPRFPPVTPDEVASLDIEISVLTEPHPLEFRSPEDLLAKLQPHRDGVVLEIGSRSATFLPQVWEQLPAKVQFLDALARKAGAAADAWRQPDTRVLTYRVEAFKESAR